MPRMTEEHRRDAERNQRLAIFDRCISGLTPRRNAQELVNGIVAAMSAQQREQLKQDIDGLNMYNCFAGHYELRPYVNQAPSLVTFSKLILPKLCPDCGFEWDNHNPNCPQFGNDPRVVKPVPSQHKGGRPKKRPNGAPR